MEFFSNILSMVVVSFIPSLIGLYPPIEQRINAKDPPLHRTTVSQNKDLEFKYLDVTEDQHC